ncbi:MAG: hypothetical protein ABSA27_01455 [Terriglobales bacterium]|jgi:hypothetical protein
MPRSFAVNKEYFSMTVEVALSLMLALLMALALPTTLQAQGPALTTISSTVYRADGTAASGTVLISWPSFQTAEGDAVAAGNLSVTIGPLGAFTAQLVPNVGASPAGTYYVVVFQLDDGTIRTEYWAVPATSPTTIAGVLTTPGTGLGNLAATQQYVNAIDATDVHLAGTETITGTKQFTVPPSLPTPVGANDAANKGYVDTAVSSVGSGAYVPLAGGTMSGPLTLPSDPTNPATQIAPATVLFDDVITNAPGFCTYALINADNIQCSLAFTYIWLPVDALVRGTLPGEDPVTVLTGSLLDGAECQVTTAPALEFYPDYIPAANELIEVSYRGQGHAAARVINSASIAAHQRGGDDGVRGSVREIGLPGPRTDADCEIAALALLDDAGQGWSGEYRAWSQFLPGGAADIFPGDGLAVNVPSRMATFMAIVREVDLEIADIAGENSRYTLRFVDSGDPSLDFAFVTALMKQTQVLTPMDVTAVGNFYLADLTDAEVTNVTSTTVTIDAGVTPPAGGGVEVRNSDQGWGAGYNGNLIGRFTNGSFTLTRYARAQDYFLRSYDDSTPPKYSRYSTALHVDYPLT